jgi:NADPH:quinone reductase
VRAVVAGRNGGATVVEVRDIPAPQMLHGQTLIRVASAGLNFSDLQSLAGGYAAPTPPFVPGIEVAGEVSDSGMPVIALVTHGGYAEAVLADSRLAFDAHDLPLDSAGGYGLVTLACYFGLKHAARLEPGETVLVPAAAGGLGSTALQLARALGAGRVIAVASTGAKRDLALRLGADQAFAYGEPLPPVDVVVDGVGGEAFLEAYRATRRFGRVLLIGASSGSAPAIPGFQELRDRSVALVPFSFKALRAGDPEFVAREAPRALDLIRRGEVAPVVGEAFSFDRAGEALRRLASRSSTGKLVLRP